MAALEEKGKAGADIEESNDDVKSLYDSDTLRNTKSTHCKRCGSKVMKESVATFTSHRKVRTQGNISTRFSSKLNQERDENSFLQLLCICPSNKGKGVYSKGVGRNDTFAIFSKSR